LTYLKMFAVVGMLPVLAGCGSQDGGITFAPVGSGPITKSEIENVYDDLNRLGNQVDSSDVRLVRPDVAVATYNGFVGFDLDSANSVTGRISMVADFSSNNVTGSAGNFSVFDNTIDPTDPVENLSGTVPISNGAITGTAMTADLNGSVVASTGTYIVNSSLSGQFADISGQSVVAGEVSGSLNNPDTSTTVINGGFLAVQN